MNPAYERVYHHHVRKTAGTSLNAAFWDLAGLDLQTMAGISEIERNGLRFVRANAELIAKGEYFFANSHTPAYQLRIPPNTFTVTILRDPVARTVSFYRLVLWAKANPSARDVEPTVDKLQALTPSLQGNFRDFLERIPRYLLFAQVTMFSPRMDPAEAAEHALACTAICFTETFTEDLQRLSATLDLDLKEKQERRLDQEVDLSQGDLEELREFLAPEYAMIERVREGLGDQG